MVLGDGPACGPRGWSWWVVLAGGPGWWSWVVVLGGVPKARRHALNAEAEAMGRPKEKRK